MEKIIAKMRADWSVVAEARVASGEWTVEDEKEIGLAVKAAVDSRQADTIALWARWLADLACSVVFFNLVVRGTETAMRNAAAAERAKRAGGK